MSTPSISGLKRPRPNIDATRAAIRMAGGAIQAARKLNVERYQSVQSWNKCGIPVPYCARVEKLVDGALTRRDFYPDDWQEIWPEMVGAQQEAACA